MKTIIAVKGRNAGRILKKPDFMGTWLMRRGPNYAAWSVVYVPLSVDGYYELGKSELFPFKDEREPDRQWAELDLSSGRIEFANGNTPEEEDAIREHEETRKMLAAAYAPQE